jgi:Rho-binding antiterminator
MISCSEYDVIELVCLYNYPIELTLKCGVVIAGVALDTKRNQSGQECLKIGVDKGIELVLLDQIAQLKVKVKNPHINRIRFG